MYRFLCAKDGVSGMSSKRSTRTAPYSITEQITVYSAHFLKVSMTKCHHCMSVKNRNIKEVLLQLFFLGFPVLSAPSRRRIRPKKFDTTT